MIDIARKIDKLRVERGWSIYKLSHEAGISNQTFHSWLSGKSLPTLPPLENICEALGITLADLFCENEMIELTPEIKDLLHNWGKLTDEEKKSFKGIIETLVRDRKN